MPFDIRCESCSKDFNVPDEAEGKKVKCPCGVAFIAINKAANAGPPPLPKPAVEANQSHDVTLGKGTFWTGFKITMGVLAALAVVAIVSIGGCLYMASQAAKSVVADFKDGFDELDSTYKSISEEMDEKEKEWEADYKRRMDEYEKQIRQVTDNVYTIGGTIIKPKESYGDWVLSFVLSNKSDVPINWISCNVRVAAPDRTFPYAEGAMNYDIPGGLEPGETQTLRLVPGIFSSLDIKNHPEDAEVTMKVIDANWPDKPSEPSFK